MKNNGTESGHAEIAELLIKYGADVNAKDTDGLTALDYAVREGHAEIAELLIKSGARVDIKALYFAVVNYLAVKNEMPMLLKTMSKLSSCWEVVSFEIL